jgi:hypothetical protein
VSGDYLWDRRGEPDPEIARLEALLAPLGQSDPPRPLRLPAAPRTRRPFAFFAALAAEAALVAALVGAAWWGRTAVRPGLEVTRLAGEATVGADPVRDRGTFPVGQWLHTNGDGRASIEIGDIGRVEIDPSTRLGLLSTKPGDYRLQLSQGTMHAIIWAPPGQFAVETTSSTAIDLGCVYSLTIDDEGLGLVRVSTGWVGFEWRGRESFIPAGALARTRRGLGPGTPFFEETSPAFQAALDTIDLGRASAAERAAALDRVLGEAQRRDTVTLWHLLSRVDAPLRDRVFDRLAGFVPPPAGVTRDGIRAADRTMLDDWWNALDLGSTNWWRVWRQQWRDGPEKLRPR